MQTVCPGCNAANLGPDRTCPNCHRRWLYPAEIARTLGISQPRVSELLDEGRLPSIRVPSQRMVDAADVEEWRRARDNRRTRAG